MDALQAPVHRASVTVQSIIDTHTRVSEEFARAHKADKMPAIDSLDVIKEHAQRYFNDATLKNQQTSLLEDATAADKARLRSCAHKKSGAWLNCIPKLALFKMNPAEFRICLRLRLGLEQLCIRTDVKCKCGVFPDALGVHYLTCTTGNHLKTRHEVVSRAYHEMVQATGKLSEIRGLEDRLPGFTGPKGYRLVLD